MSAKKRRASFRNSVKGIDGKKSSKPKRRVSFNVGDIKQHSKDNENNKSCPTSLAEYRRMLSARSRSDERGLDNSSIPMAALAQLEWDKIGDDVEINKTKLGIPESSFKYLSIGDPCHEIFCEFSRSPKRQTFLTMIHDPNFSVRLYDKVLGESKSKMKDNETPSIMTKTPLRRINSTKGNPCCSDMCDISCSTGTAVFEMTTQCPLCVCRSLNCSDSTFNSKIFPANTIPSSGSRTRIQFLPDSSLPNKSTIFQKRFSYSIALTHKHLHHFGVVYPHLV